MANTFGAWDELLGASMQLIYAAVSGIGTTEDQRDAVQDTCEAIFTRLGQLNDPRFYPGWVTTVGRRAALRYVNQPVDTLPAKLAAVAQAPEQEIVDRLAAVAAIGQALSSLTAHQQQVVTALMAVERPNYARMAKALSCPVGSLGPTRKRAIERLRQDPTVRALRLTSERAA